MPFTKRYSHLGNTTRMYVPDICYSHIEDVLSEYNRLCETKGEEFLNKILDSLVDRLKNIE